jgi:hypothetical protein
MTGDGNCLFRAVGKCDVSTCAIEVVGLLSRLVLLATKADQVYGDAEMHDEVRSRCMDYMVTSSLLRSTFKKSSRA